MFDFDTGHFIQEVEARPAIWDSENPFYSNKVEKQKAWDAVYGAMSPDYQKKGENEKKVIGKLLQRKWRSLRDCFVREVNLQNRETRSTSGASRRKPYVYFDQLIFLKPSVSKRKTLPTLDDNSQHNTTNDDNDSDIEVATPLVTIIDDDDEDDEENEIDEDVLSPQIELIEMNKSNDQNFQNHLKRKHSDISRAELKLLRNDEGASSQETKNQDRMFLLSLENDLAQVPENHKLDAKIEIMTVIKKWKQSRIVVSVLGTNSN